MPLIKGMMLSFSDPLLALIPTIVFFQYNPTSVTRVLTSPAPATGSTGEGAVGGGGGAAKPSSETYSLKLELDATDGIASDGPLTTVFGIGPRLAALEMLMQPVGSSLLGNLIGGALGGPPGATIPAGKLPVVLFAWGPGRITPVELRSLTINETAFDTLLNPIHATADLSLTVLRKEDLPKDDKVARLAADYYKGLREVKAVIQLPQMIELGG
ncbi:hypothetical protein [Actinomadura sp. 6N118]|uniref:hypothetical protein n=1 Tax=Actinomadura sp. 6N118 TaxID=3375151 RepID=UPI0037B9AC15